MKLRSAVIILLLGFLQPATTTGGLEDFHEAIKPPLEGLEEMFVLVEDLLPSSTNLGLTKDQMLTDAELKLRLAGIKVLDPESTNAFRSSYVYIRVASIDDKLGGTSIGISFSYEVRLMEPAFLKRAPERLVLAASWKCEKLGTGPNKGYVSEVRRGLKDCLDKFLNDYLAANPKE